MSSWTHKWLSRSPSINRLDFFIFGDT